MERYDFKVRGAVGAISVVHSAVLSDLLSVWSVVAEIADNFDKSGAGIVVTNNAGEVVILIGVETACTLPIPRRGLNTGSILREAALCPQPIAGMRDAWRGEPMRRVA